MKIKSIIISLGLLFLLTLPASGELTVIPNPFNSDSETSTIIYTPNEAVDVTIGVYDNNESLVKRLFAGKVEEKIEIPWNGRNDYDDPLPEGSYTIKAQSNQRISLIVQYNSHIHYGTDAVFIAGESIEGQQIYIAVANHFGHQIEFFDYQGNLQGRFGTYGFDTGNLYFPYGIACDETNGIVYVSDSSGKIRSLNISKGLDDLSDKDFEIFFDDKTFSRIQGLDVFGTYLYACCDGTLLKIDKDGKAVDWTVNMGDAEDVPDVCAAIPSSSSPNTRVYFINNSSGTFPGLYRIDEDTGFSITHRVTPGILTEPGAEWKSISY
ncbi:MAG: FlgD immunoglobulin-like domain containing protein, partial [bacterium]|nr:FlgD immunoglobulin-like domain containing protein [bacterium]